VVKDLLNEVVKNLLPNKTFQRVKLHLRREARKPLDMSVKQYIMHVYHMKTEEIARCPLACSHTQCLTPDKIIAILLFGTPKSWQREMDRQEFDPRAKTVTNSKSTASSTKFGNRPTRSGNTKTEPRRPYDDDYCG